MKLTRRSVLQAGAAAGVAAVPAASGCVASARPEGYAALYALSDLADRIAGDRLEVATPVPTGVHGHGWSPGGDLQTRVAEAQLFLYPDSPAWSWAQSFVSNFEHEAVDVHAVDVLADVDLLEWDGHGDGGDEEHGDGEHGGEGHSGEEHDANGTGGHGDQDGEDHDDHTDEREHADDHERDHAAEPDHDDHGHDDPHGHGQYDPHVWLDPIRAQTVVDTIADALVHVDPGGEETVRANADATKRDLADLDRAFREAVEDAERTEVVLAGHDSFRYLTDRYGIEFETPTGVSPDARASQDDLVALVEFVDDRGVEYVCYDAFEGDRYARPIVEDSSAEAALPLTPLTSTTETWEREAGGVVAQLQQVNLRHLRRAMGAD